MAKNVNHVLGQIVNHVTLDRTSVPTNATVSQFISTFKRFCNREYGRNIWQARSNDHIIRGKDDYRKIWEYIDTNVLRWETDCFYKNEKDR